MPSKLDYRIRPYLLFDMPQIRVPLANGFVTSKDSVADVVPASSDTGPFCSSLPRQVVARRSSHSASEYPPTRSLRYRDSVCLHYTQRNPPFSVEILRPGRDDEWYCNPGEGPGFWVHA
ncbi:hypothetical protein C8F01DRAFT_1369355 [Mycena amicta]|nr:hypothetical protein C8F01DRAFT_1369355 [Mycena amicta]